ncbi:hypothetical protein [Georgenia yuyongxinii]|uniref:Peptidyl-tRNA hydrolase n=1 Tax=Georgenia yuyongxinii TaxID=2589797 RepID=A0A552WRY7_9MICO|nr:hypothetical protein [Georgenia yuyongxinii]TRW45591.1 hypothetical protein FJ693_08635 [Georgenia yuyongxinii]
MDLVQPILVARTGEHAATVSCAARASLLAYVQPLMAGAPVASIWETWLTDSDGAIATTVREAGPDDLDAAARWAEQQLLGHLLIADGSSAALALAPMSSSELRAVVVQMPESDTDLPRHEVAAKPAPTTVRVEVLASLTTTSAAGHAVRAMWAWAVPQLIDAPEPLAEWARTGGAIDLAVVDELDTRDGAFVVNDQGAPAAVAIPGRILRE